MWGATKNNQAKSGLFEGINFIGKCMGDFFGKLLDAVKKTSFNLEKLNVPKVVVIGSESSGKSSLLENIVKCQLFPKNTTFCTKIPIHLVLKGVNDKSKISYQLIYNNELINTSKDDIYNQIEKIMNGIDNTIIDDSEILIQISEINMIDFEFYDLPGIRAYPQDLNEKTTKLAKKYLSMENVIPICVIPATTPRITSYIPMALIKEYKKEAETIICLTMCDRLQDENIEELLINRIAMTTDEYDSNTFSGVCGIINRTHRNNVKLNEHDRVERDWFRNNIYEGMPANYIHKDKLINNLGIEKLIEKLSVAYKKYVDDKWIPSIIEKIQKDNIKLKDELHELGFDPSNVEDKKKFIVYFKDYFKNNFHEFMKKLLDSNYDYIRDEYGMDKYKVNGIVNIEFFMNMLPIYYKSYFLESHKYLSFIKDINEAVNVNDIKFVINMDRFNQLNAVMSIIIANKHEEFKNDFLEKYSNLIEYDYLTCSNINDIISYNPSSGKKKLNYLFDKYVQEFSIEFNKMINGTWHERLRQSMKELKETTHDERIKINLNIKNNLKAIEELQEIKIGITNRK